MKEIHFGFSNQNNPTGIHEGIGASPNFDIIRSDFLDVIELNNNVYLISKVSLAFQENKIVLLMLER